MSKDTAQKIIGESLDNAILDMAKPTVMIKKKVRKNTNLPENFTEVVKRTDVIETPIVVLDHSNVDTILVKPKIKSKKIFETKQEKGQNKKLKGFFGKQSKKVSVEKMTKPSKRVRSSYFHFGGKLSSVYGKYRNNLMTGMLTLLMLVFVTATTYVTYAYVTSRDADLVNSVAKHVVLSTNETPKVYIVQSEKADLFKNPLFKGIQVGDNVLTYANEGRVIIYRSSEDKIVNIVNLQE